MANHTFRLILLLFLSLTPTSIPRAAAQQPSHSPGDDNLNTHDVSPSMAVILIVLVLAFFITGSVSIYIQQCTDSSSSSTIPSTFPMLVGGGVPAQPRGLERSVIDTFPTFVYSSVKELKMGKGALECAVCLSEFEDDETLRLLPKCDHVFHTDCIDTWLVGHDTCPVCRANLVPTNSPESTRPTNPDDIPETSSNPGDDQTQRTSQVRIAIINDDETTSSKRNPNRKLPLPRSHSTGHSLGRPEEDWDRFTLRLPAEVRRQLVARARLKRATSMVALPRESSSRRGYRRNGDGEGSGSSRYGRVLNFLFPPFGSRTGSVRSTLKGGIDREGMTGTGSVSSKRAAGNAVTPLETLPSLPV